MRKIRQKERQRAGNIYCQFCKAEGQSKVHAEWRTDGLPARFACGDHKVLLLDAAADHLSEADNLTWVRL